MRMDAHLASNTICSYCTTVGTTSLCEKQTSSSAAIAAPADGVNMQMEINGKRLDDQWKVHKKRRQLRVNFQPVCLFAFLFHYLMNHVMAILRRQAAVFVEDTEVDFFEASILNIQYLSFLASSSWPSRVQKSSSACKPLSVLNTKKRCEATNESIFCAISHLSRRISFQIDEFDV